MTKGSRSGKKCVESTGDCVKKRWKIQFEKLHVLMLFNYAHPSPHKELRRLTFVNAPVQPEGYDNCRDVTTRLFIHAVVT